MPGRLKGMDITSSQMSQREVVIGLSICLGQQLIMMLGNPMELMCGILYEAFSRPSSRHVQH